MATIYMADEQSGLFMRPTSARATPSAELMQAAASGARLRMEGGGALGRVSSAGDTARGKPPPVSARFVVGLQWAFFAVCVVRILFLAPQ